MSDCSEELPTQTIEALIDPWVDRRSRFVKMCGELVVQADRFTNGANPDNDRSAAVRSLAAVTQFISEAVPSAPQLCHALVQLGLALADLDAGEMPPMLNVPRNAQRGKRPTANEMRYAVASAYITQRIQDGSSLANAAREAQLLFEKYAVPLPGKTDNALRDWRKRIGQREKMIRSRSFTWIFLQAHGKLQWTRAGVLLTICGLFCMIKLPNLKSQISILIAECKKPHTFNPS